MTAIPRSQQNPKRNHLHPPFDGKAPTIQLEDWGYRYREKEILTGMKQVEVATEVRMVRTVQGSMAVDQEADRLKVSRCLPAGHQPNSNSSTGDNFYYPIGANHFF